MLTYEQLKLALEQLTPEQLAENIAVYDGKTHDYFGVDYFTIASEESLDVFDDMHPFLVFNAVENDS